MFLNTQLQSIPFNINFGTSTVKLESIFNGASFLRTLPYLYNPKPNSIDYMFNHMNYLQNIPNDYFDTWDFSSNLHSISARYIFEHCCSLRKIPETFFNRLDLQNGYSTSFAEYFGLLRLAD